LPKKQNVFLLDEKKKCDEMESRLGRVTGKSARKSPKPQVKAKVDSKINVQTVNIEIPFTKSPRLEKDQTPQQRSKMIGDLYKSKSEIKLAKPMQNDVTAKIKDLIRQKMEINKQMTEIRKNN
jgi:hypothetical protein